MFVFVLMDFIPTFGKFVSILLYTLFQCWIQCFSFFLFLPPWNFGNYPRVICYSRKVICPKGNSSSAPIWFCFESFLYHRVRSDLLPAQCGKAVCTSCLMPLFLSKGPLNMKHFVLIEKFRINWWVSRFFFHYMKKCLEIHIILSLT